MEEDEKLKLHPVNNKYILYQYMYMAGFHIKQGGRICPAGMMHWIIPSRPAYLFMHLSYWVRQKNGTLLCNLEFVTKAFINIQLQTND